MAIGPYIRSGAWLRVRSVRVEGHPQRGAFLDEPYPGVPVAVQAAFVPFGLAEPAFQVAGVLGHVCLLTPNTQPGGTPGPPMAQVVPDRRVARVALRRHDLQRRLTLGTGAPVGCAPRLERPHLVHVRSPGLVDVVHCRQPAGARACSPCTARMRRPPVCASTCRWSAACPSSQASARRPPGGGRGPP